jgi:hypothetical protein
MPTSALLGGPQTPPTMAEIRRAERVTAAELRCGDRVLRLTPTGPLWRILVRVEAEPGELVLLGFTDGTARRWPRGATFRRLSPAGDASEVSGG